MACGKAARYHRNPEPIPPFSPYGVFMRATIVCLLLIQSLFVFSSEALAQKKRKKPGRDRENSNLALEESRMSPELIELLKATSAGYELDGKLVPPAMQAEEVLKAAKSNTPAIRELAQLQIELLYLAGKLLNREIKPEIERAAQTSLADIKAEYEKVMLARITEADREKFKEKLGFLDDLIEQGRDDGKFPRSSEITKAIEQLGYGKSLKEAVLQTKMMTVAQVKGLAAKERVRELVGKPSTQGEMESAPIKAKLQTKMEKHIVVALTNTSEKPLQDCLLIARAVPNPKLVEKTAQGRLSALLLAGAFGFGDAFRGDKNSDPLDNVILLRAELEKLERGGMVFVPEIPAGSTVCVGLIAAQDLPLLKESSLFFTCNDLAIGTLRLDTGVKPVLTAGTRLDLGADGAVVHKSELASTDSRDPKSTPGTTQACKIFTVSLEAGKTYIVETSVDQSGYRVFDPPIIRIENEQGQVMSSTKEKSPASIHRVLFAPEEKAEYRLVCTEGFHGVAQGPGKFKVSIYSRGKAPAKSASAGKEKESDDLLSATLEDIEYTYQGVTRNGKEMFVTISAKSKNGNQEVSQGQMILVDQEGNQYTGAPRSGMGATFKTPEGKSVNLIWRFGPNAFTGTGSAPSEKIDRFASMTVEIMRPKPGSFTLQNLPAGRKAKK
jgi:hypothetical protein